MNPSTNSPLSFSLSNSDLAALQRLDTPTVCNALEIVAPERRGSGYTVFPFHCPRPELSSIVGYARTATIRAMQPSGRTASDDTATRIAYYHYVGERSGDVPTIMVIEDLDVIPGYGAWWGEVNTTLHQALGSVGVVTNGSIRDLDDSAPGFHLLAGAVGPSHAWVHVVDFAKPVTVHGMAVEDGDLIHADQHGAVVIPHDVAADIPAAASTIAANERRLLDAAERPDFNAALLAQLLGGGEGH